MSGTYIRYKASVGGGGGGGGSGTVTQVNTNGLATGGPITTTGTISVASVSLTNQIVGNLPVTNLNTGSGASSATFWRGDGTWATAAGTGANTALSNLSAVAVNTALLPGTDFSIGSGGLNLGSTTNRWSSLFANTINDVSNSVVLDITNKTLFNSAGNAAFIFGGVNPILTGTGNDIIVKGGGAGTTEIARFFNLSGFSISGSTGSKSITQVYPSTGTSYSIAWPASQSSGVQTLQNDGTGVLSWTNPSLSQTSGSLSLTGQVVNILPIANGGTNSGTALNNNRMIISSGGSLVETTAFTSGNVLFTDANGLPNIAPSFAFTFDSTNNFLKVVSSQSSSSNPRGMAIRNIGSTGLAGVISLQAARGVFGGSSAIQNLDTFGLILFGGFGATGFQNSAAIFASATQNYTDTNTGSRLSFQTTVNSTSSRNNALIIDQDQSANWFNPGGDSVQFFVAGTTTSYSMSWPTKQGSPGQFLQNNGVGSLTFATAATQNQIFTVSSSFVFPANTTPAMRFKFTVIGAGGGGGGASGSALQPGGNGGGAGATAIKWLTGSANSTILVTVGLGGAAGGSAADGTTGSVSTLTSLGQIITTVTANGGIGGKASGANQARAAGGSATNGDLNIPGGDGTLANVLASLASTGGSGGGSSLGSGGAGGGDGGNNAGSPGAPYGAGGGGGSGQSVGGGNGAAGLVTVEWVG